MDDLFGVIELPLTLRPEQLISHDVPEGYQTVAGWWATMEREALELLEEPIPTIFHEEEQIALRARRLGYDTKRCSAPEAFRRLRFNESLCFPIGLLHEFYPPQP